MLKKIIFIATLLTVLTTVKVRASYQDRINKIKFKLGDIVVVPAVMNCDVSPYHWMFAVSDKELAGISFSKPRLFNFVAEIIILDERFRSDVFRIKASIVPRVPNRPDMSRKGAIVARRLRDQKVYYHLLRCNCRHYVDYFAYGRVYGTKINMLHLPMNNRCPLYNIITEDTDVTSPDFKLKDGNGKEYELLPYNKYMTPK